MADAIDKATGQPTQVPDSELVSQWAAGKVEPIQGAQYHVKLKDGRYGTIPGEHLANAAKLGAEVVSPDEANAAHLQALYGGEKGAELAQTTGMLGQFTGGLSDQAMLGAAKLLESTGVRKPGYAKAFEEHEQSAQEQHPIRTAIGEGAGAAALTAVLPGGGLAGAGERGALALTEGLGETAASRVAQRALVGGARGALEGTQYGIAKTVSDDAFSNHELTAAHALSTIGANTLYGAGLGSIFGAGGGLASELAPKVKSAATSALDTILRRGQPKAEDVEKLVADNFGADAAPGLGDKAVKYIGALAKITGKDRETAERFAKAALHPEEVSAELQAIEGVGEEAKDANVRNFVDTMNHYAAETKPFASPEGIKLKKSYVAAAVDQMDDAAKNNAGKAVLELADGVTRKIKGMRANPKMFGNAEEMKDLAEQAAVHNRVIAESVENGNLAHAYMELDDWKRTIGRPKGALERNLAPNGGGSFNTEGKRLAAQERSNMYGSIYNQLQSGMEDTSVWGRIGEQQHAVNSQWHQQIALAKEFRSALTTHYGLDDGNAWLTGTVVDPAKAYSFLRNMDSPSKDLVYKTVIGHIDNTAALGRAILERGELEPEMAAAIKSSIGTAERAKATLTKTADLIKAENQWAQLKNGITQNAGLAPAVIGGLITHGPIGGILGLGLAKAARVAMNTGDSISHLATFVKWQRQSENRTVRALVDFASGKARPKVPLDSSTYVRRTAQVSEMMANPDKLAERIGTNLGELRTRAPRLADAMTGAALNGIQFLYGKLPIQPPADPFEPNRKPPLPPIGQRESWLRYYNAVQDPLTVLDDLRDGRINMEGVETLRDVYPQLFQRVRQQTFDLMAGGKMGTLNKQQKIGLALALGIPTPELDPAYVAARQAVFTQQPGAQQEAPAGGKGGKPKRTRAINITKNSPMLTVDRLESGSPASLR